MNINNIINLINKKINKSNFYNICDDKKNLNVVAINIEESTFGTYIKVWTNYVDRFENMKEQEWKIDIKNSVFQNWKDEQKLADKIFKLIYNDGEKYYSWSGRLMWSNQDW